MSHKLSKNDLSIIGDVYIKENGRLAFIKPANYKISKTRKYKKDIS